MFEKILVATDFSHHSLAALHAGLNLARRCLCELQVVHVVSVPEDLYGVWQKMDHFFTGELYPKCKREVLDGHPVFRQILDYALKNESQLIVAGSHGGTIADIFMGSVAQQLVRNSTIPVLVVRGTEQVESCSQSFERILVPSDFSPASRAALDFGIRFSNFLQADLHLVHVVDLPKVENLREMYAASGWTIPESNNLNVDPVLQDMLSETDASREPTIATLIGDPVKELIRYAHEEKIDLIVMGTRGRKGLERLLLGSVTASMISKSDVPVIAISSQRL